MKTIKKIITTPLLIGLGIAAHSASAIELTTIDNTKFEFTGYFKADAIMSQYSDGRLPPANIGRDFYVPGVTPVGGESSSVDTDFSAKQTRFGFRTTTGLDNGSQITSYIEMDFMATPNGNERVSNSYTPRLRHAFVKYNSLLVGQTWTTFMNVSSLPESLDFIGTTDGSPFIRQVQVRYSIGNLDISAENPETTLTPAYTNSRVITDSGAMPDLVAKYHIAQGKLKMSIAGIARQLNYDDNNGDTTDTLGYGISVAGKMEMANGDIRVSATAGDGLGRYMGLNFANGAVLNADSSLDSIASTAATFAYRHLWNHQWRSNIMASFINVDAPENVASTMSSSAYSSRINVIYSPVKKLDFGAELAYANRELVSGDSGSMNRLQFSAKYAF